MHDAATCAKICPETVTKRSVMTAFCDKLIISLFPIFPLTYSISTFQPPTEEGEKRKKEKKLGVVYAFGL